MTAELTTEINQFSITNGTMHTKPRNQLAVRAEAGQTGDLFVLTRILGGNGTASQLESQLAQTVRDSFYNTPSSMTGGLRRAIQQANAQLYQHNAQLEVDDRAVGGVVAVAVDNEDVFVAQIGPTALFKTCGNRVERYPQRSAWLDGGEQADVALGISQFVAPQLHHLSVAEHDRLLLVDDQLSAQLRPTELQRTDDMNLLLDHLRETSDEGSALALSVTQTNENFGFDMSAATNQLSKLLPSHDEPTVTETVVEDKARLDRFWKPVKSTPEDLLDDGPVVAKASAPSPLNRLGDAFKGLFKKDDATQTEPHAPNRPPFNPFQQPQTVMASTVPTPAFETNRPAVNHSDDSDRYDNSADELPGYLTILQQIGMALLMTVAALGSGLRTMLGLVIPADQADDEPRRAGTQAYIEETQGQPQWSWQAIAIVAVVIPLVVGAIVAISYLRNVRLEDAEYAATLTNAQDRIEQSALVDNVAALQLLGEAEELLAQADTLRPAQPEIASLQAQLAEQADTIGKVTRLPSLIQLRQYNTTNTNLKSLLVQGVEVYILDSGANLIYHHRLNDSGDGLLDDTPEQLYLVSQGQQVDDITVNNLLGMIWMPAGGNRQTSDLLILNSTGLLEFSPNWGVTTISLSGQDELVRPTAIASYFGNFYILDAQANKLWRYLPTTDGYSTPPESYFPIDQPINLTGAIDLAIDGSIYVLYQNGQISKFASGRPVEFKITGLDQPLRNPVALYTAPDEDVQYLYIADAGNKRIVQLDKEGQFIRQFKAPVNQLNGFAQLQDLYVDEIGGKLYVLDGNNPYLAQLPPLE